MKLPFGENTPSGGMLLKRLYRQHLHRIDANRVDQMSNQTCSVCGANISSYDGVSVGYEEGTKFMCSRSYNESMAEHLGLDYEHASFDPLIIDGKPITWEELGRMVAPNTGLRFKLEIFDRSEEK